jgi:hypothetical protein
MLVFGVREVEKFSGESDCLYLPSSSEYFVPRRKELVAGV